MAVDEVAGITAALEQAFDRPPASCLCVDLPAHGALAQAVAAFLAPFDGACERLDVGSPAASPEDLPSLAEILGFERRRTGDMDRALAIYGAAYAAAKDAAPGAPDGFQDLRARKPFDLVVLDGGNPLSGAALPRLREPGAVLVGRIRDAYGGARAFETLFTDAAYTLAAGGEADGWALFLRRDRASGGLPIHFFTIVLNGEPFIRYHEAMLTRLSCRWHWHIIEGVASLVKDTAWSVAAGGHIPADLHDEGRSNDGTSAYLDDLAARFPDRVTVYRKPLGEFWNGKLEMVSAPLPNIDEPCLLWQVDGDELWSVSQVERLRAMFVAEPERSAAKFWCNYFVGPDKGISTYYNYAQNPNQDWLRVWRFEPGMIWDKHEPPTLSAVDPATETAYDVGGRNPFTHRDTEKAGLKFDHFAYATQAQVQFKESYYGYAGAVERWRELQAHGTGSGHLRDYFPWVSDETMFDTSARLGWRPLARLDPGSGAWVFAATGEPEEPAVPETRAPLRIVVDGIFFQIAKSGIARLWSNLLAAWVRSGFAEHVVVLDRAGTAPRIDGVIYRTIDRHPLDTIAADATLLQWACDQERADLFLSSYYTVPTHTPSVFMGYDMIPEMMGFDLSDGWWQQKRRAIQYASGHVMISNNSAEDMVRLHPGLGRDDVLVAYCAIDPVFTPCTGDETAAFRRAYGIDGDFVLLVGDRQGWKGYKNGLVVYAALALIPTARRPLLVCVGGTPELEELGQALLPEEGVRILKLGDDDLRAAYGAARAFICPSFFEGFGLPIGEAMAVGCPVLASPTTSIPEVAGDAALYFDPRDPASLAAGIEAVADPDRRAAMIAAGSVQVRKFDQARSAQQIATYCGQVVERLRTRPDRRPRDLLADVYALQSARETAEAEAERLRTALFDARIAMSDLSHLAGQGGRRRSGAGGSDQDRRQLISIERRLARAYARLSGEEEEIAPEVVFQFDGFGGSEGPYPQLGVERAFRWQTSSPGTVTIIQAPVGAAVMRVRFANLIAGQRLSFTLDDVVVGHVVVPATGWDRTYAVELPVTLTQPRATLQITAALKDAQAERDLHIAFYDVALVAEDELDDHRSAQEDLLVCGAAELVLGFDGFGGLEGPYPQLGVERAFRWQTARMGTVAIAQAPVGPAMLRVRFANLIAGQRLSFSLDDVEAGEVAVPETGWDHTYAVELPVTLTRPEVTLRIVAALGDAQADRDLHVALYDVAIVAEGGPDRGIGEDGESTADQTLVLAVSRASEDA